jgi:hypothetical protein
MSSCATTAPRAQASTTTAAVGGLAPPVTTAHDVTSCGREIGDERVCAVIPFTSWELDLCHLHDVAASRHAACPRWHIVASATRVTDLMLLSVFQYASNKAFPVAEHDFTAPFTIVAPRERREVARTAETLLRCALAFPQRLR